MNNRKNSSELEPFLNMNNYYREISNLFSSNPISTNNFNNSISSIQNRSNNTANNLNVLDKTLESSKRAGISNDLHEISISNRLPPIIPRFQSSNITSQSNYIFNASNNLNEDNIIQSNSRNTYDFNNSSSSNLLQLTHAY